MQIIYISDGVALLLDTGTGEHVTYFTVPQIT